MSGDLATWFRAQLDNDERDARVLAEIPGAAFVLADITAKRAILDLHTREVTPPRHADDHELELVWCGDDEQDWPCDTVLLLAQPYAGRPGWRDEWTIT